MIKAELMKNYTAEQLADMVIKLNSAMDFLKYSDSFLKSGLFDNPAVAACETRINILQNKINNLEEENGRLQSKLDTYNNYLLPRCTKEAKEMIDHNNFSEVRIVTWEQWNNRNEKTMNISDIQKCQEEYEKFLKKSPLEGVMNKITKDILEQKNNAMAMEFTRIICDLLKRYGVYVHCTETKFGEKITANSIEEQYGIVFDSMDFSQHDKEFTDKIEELQSEVEKYRKAFEDAKKERDCQVAECRKKIDELENHHKFSMMQIDDILERLFGVRHDTVDKPDEFEKILKQKAESYNEIADYLCDEPISVAQTLISAKRGYELSEEEKQRSGLEKGYYHIFDISELRQIAEHLLVYCNHNGETEE